MKLTLDLGPNEELRLRQSPYMQARWYDWEAWDSPLASEWMALCDDALLKRLGIGHLRGRHLNQLSSGEFRKLRIAVALASHPQELLLKDPYAGLDADSRKSLAELIASMPELRVLPPPATATDGLLLKMPEGPWLDPGAPDIIAKLEAAHVAYGQLKVFQNLNWRIKRGERWRLSGPNGSGKSTLLALLQGDHPQAYSNTLSLFGTPRGGGESIWEIKSRIGSFSPELHAHFPRGLSIRHTLLSGFFESMGLFRRPSQAQERAAEAWLQAFGLQALAETPFGQAGFNEQRLALLARALVKRPALLLLDEPSQGLNAAGSALLRGCLESLCASAEGSLVLVSHREEDLPAGITHTLSLAPL
jgi:molybdate transport system ATP-binding protein